MLLIRPTFSLFRCLLAAILVVLGTAAASAQAGPAAPHGYDFLTLTSLESTSKAASKIYLAPAFQGKSEVQLEDFNAFGFDKNREKLQTNMQLVNQQLSELTVAGWELVQVYPLPSQTVIITRYLLRKAKS
jgi:hypothetical protein